MTTLTSVRARMKAEADPDDAKFRLRYFKTGPGEYGAGDRFLGIRVPVLRTLVREFRELSPDSRWKLLTSPWHEERALALLLLVEAYKRADAAERSRITTRYLENTRYINNWDLVDCSAHAIVGPAIPERGVPWLKRLAASPLLWDRRIAIVATFWCIKKGDYAPSLAVAEQMLEDPEELIHKALGWMLRDIGDQDPGNEQAFLRQHHARLPRTTLRYAIEHFPPAERKRYLSGKLGPVSGSANAVASRLRQRGTSR